MLVGGTCFGIEGFVSCPTVTARAAAHNATTASILERVIFNLLLVTSSWPTFSERTIPPVNINARFVGAKRRCLRRASCPYKVKRCRFGSSADPPAIPAGRRLLWGFNESDLAGNSHIEAQRRRERAVIESLGLKRAGSEARASR